MTRDAKGMIWFNVSQTPIPNHGGIGRVDPATGKIDVPPAGGNVGLGRRADHRCRRHRQDLVSAPDGILRFDPETQAYRLQITATSTPHGTGWTYGVAADRTAGHGYWAQMALDIVDRADPAGGAVQSFDVPPIKTMQTGLKAEEHALYDNFAGLDFNTPFLHGGRPRRMGADKNGTSSGSMIFSAAASHRHQDDEDLAGAAAQRRQRISLSRDRRQPPRRLDQYDEFGSGAAPTPRPRASPTSICRRSAPRRAMSRCSRKTGRWRWCCPITGR